MMVMCHPGIGSMMTCQVSRIEVPHVAVKLRDEMPTFRVHGAHGGSYVADAGAEC